MFNEEDATSLNMVTCSRQINWAPLTAWQLKFCSRGFCTGRFVKRGEQIMWPSTTVKQIAKREMLVTN